MELKAAVEPRLMRAKITATAREKKMAFRGMGTPIVRIWMWVVRMGVRGLRRLPCKIYLSKPSAKRHAS